MMFKQLLHIYKIIFTGLFPFAVALIPLALSLYFDDDMILFGMVFSIPVAAVIAMRYWPGGNNGPLNNGYRGSTTVDTSNPPKETGS